MPITKEQLQELFPEASILLTSGMEAGWIVKFHDFYLKIYSDRKKVGMVVVQAFRPFVELPDILEHVKVNNFREFASTIRTRMRG